MKERAYKEAKKQVKKKKGFYVHLAVYLAVGLFFFLLNLVTSPGDWWFFFPLLPWGIGLTIHYLTVFGFPGTDILTEDWEARELDREMRRRGYHSPDDSLPQKEESGEEKLDLDQPPSLRERQKRWEDDEIV